MCGKLRKFVFCGAECEASNVSDLISDHLSKQGVGVEACTDRSAAKSKFKQVIEGEINSSKVCVQLRHPARRFLTEREWYGIHKVGSTNLDNAGPRLCFLIEGITKRSDTWKEFVCECFCRCNVHGGWEGVVGGLSAIDVIVWVDRRFRPENTTSHLNSPVRDDLVGVHVGLGSAPSLPDAQWEMIVQCPVEHFLSSSDDQRSDLRIKLLKRHVRLCSSLL